MRITIGRGNRRQEFVVPKRGTVDHEQVSEQMKNFFTRPQMLAR